MALVDFQSPEDATNVLATWHNHEMSNGSKLFLSFTNKRQGGQGGYEKKL